MSCKSETHLIDIATAELVASLNAGGPFPSLFFMAGEQWFPGDREASGPHPNH